MQYIPLQEWLIDKLPKLAGCVPAYRQYIFAGLGEIAKQRSANDVDARWLEIIYGIPPYGDQENDYRWNTRGMRAARKGQ